MSGRCDSRLPLLVALGLLALHIAFFGAWIVDDAGITFAYSRSLAEGHGFVAQAGAVPVEGVSNALWTLLLAIPYALGIFDLVWTPKVIAFALTAATFVLVSRDLAARGASCLTISVSLILLASCSAFVIWTTSGLENALLACLVAASCTVARHAAAGEGYRGRDVLAGVLAGGLGLTRPDAVLYAAVYPLIVLAVEGRERPRQIGRLLRRWVATGIGFLPVYGGYLLFRLTYFGELVPNTYYAKQKPSLAFATPGKFLDLFESATGDFMLPALLWTAFAVLVLAWRRTLTLRTATLLSYLAVAAGAYLVMPPDWMGEFRFATPFYLLFYWTQAELALEVSAALLPAEGLRRAFRLATVAFALQAAVIFLGRSSAFAAYPTVPLQEVRTFAAQGFNQLAEVLAVENPSVLTPDLGGALLESRLRVYDLAGLCDRTIALSLGRGDYDRFYAYVFDEVKPTFIHTHGSFTRLSRLYQDPRFAHDYVPLHESMDGPPVWQAMWAQNPPVPPWAGDYVRRDALGIDLAKREMVQQVYRRAGLAEFRPWLRPPDRLGQGWPQLSWAITQTHQFWIPVRAPF